MSFIKEAVAQVKIIPPFLLIVYVFLLALLTLIAIISEKYNIPFAYFTSDPTAVLDGHPLVGAISNIGILFWCSTAAVCLFVSTIHRKKGNAIIAKFLLYSSSLTSVLLIDDLFMLHEDLLPIYLHIPQTLIYAAYLSIILIYFIKFSSMILQTEFILLFIACAFLGLSVGVDIFLSDQNLIYLVEDGFKLFGIITWFIYFTRLCIAQTIQLIKS